MANFQNTVKLDALAMLQENANKDLRPSSYGATMAFNDHKREVILNFDEFRNIESEPDLQDRKIDYVRRDSDTVNSSRSASLTGAYGTSTRSTLAFVTYAREFSISDDQARANTLGAVKLMAAQLKNARLDIAAEIESDAVAKLEAYVNTVQGSRSEGTWDSTNYVMEIALTNKDQYFNYVSTGMRTLDYNGQLQSIHTPFANSAINYQMAQGVGNATNMQYQYPDFDMYTSSSVTNLSDYLWTSYAVEVGSLGLVDWVPAKNRAGRTQGLWDFSVIPDPMGIHDSGLALAAYETVVDNSSGGNNVGGNTQDATTIYELSIDVAFFIPTITTQKLVNKYGLLSS